MFCLRDLNNRIPFSNILDVRQITLSRIKTASSRAAVALALLLGTTCGASARTAPAGHSFTGYSHHYGDHLHGRRTSSGQPHNKFKLTAAHRTLPFGTHLHVTNTRNGKSCVVVVNDRGPFGSPSLVLDVSKAAAHALGFPGGGKIPISAKVIDPKAGAEGLKTCEQLDTVRNYVAKNCDDKTIVNAANVAKPPIVAAKPASTATSFTPKQAPDDADYLKLIADDLQKAVAAGQKNEAAAVATEAAPVVSESKTAASTAKPVVSQHAVTTAKSVVSEHPAAKAVAQKPAGSENKSPVSEPRPDGDTTFLLVINDSLDNGKSGQHTAKHADYNTTARHAPHLAPTVFIPMAESKPNAARPEKKPATARSIPDGSTLM